MENPTVQLAFASFYFFSLFAGVPLAVGITWFLLARLRRRVAHLMGTSSREPPLADSPGETATEEEGAGELGVRLFPANRQSRWRASEVAGASRRAARRVAALYLISGCALPAVLVALLVSQTDIASGWTTPLQWSVGLGWLFLVNSTPALLAGATALDGRLRSLVVAVLLQLAALWALDGVIGGHFALRLWLLTSLGATAAVLLLNTRRLRAVGPGVYAGTVLIVCGIGMGQLFGWRWIMYRVGYSWEDLRELYRPVQSRLAELPLRGRVELWLDFVQEPSRFMPVPEVGRALWLQFFVISLGAALLGIGAAWFLAKRLARTFETRRASDLMIRVDVLMLVYTLAISLAHSTFLGPVAAWGLAGFAGYRLLSRRLLRVAPRTDERRPRALLHLRVFGFDRRTQALLDDLQQRWRHLGPIHLISGADVAYATVELYEFLQFIEGRLAQAFVQSEEDLEQRLAEIQTTPDPDGRYRVHDFFCYHDTWRPTMSALAERADVALMDLRGFGPANRGCIFEIEQLLVTVHPDRIVLVIDGSTDQSFLRRTLQSAWKKGALERPGDHAEARPLRILEASTRRRRTVEALMDLLHEAGRPACADPV